ncbi:OmpA family protein [Sulfitobacter sp. PS-8MA]|uniref:OmpA family protein n=1 Tax=Sulfitobacter sp. PS-8MA TaxID=3237707 RepID=UPI0034C690DD
MKTLLKSTTSLGLSLALAFPHGAFAQQQDVPACGPVGEASEFPCAFEDQTVESAEELRIAAELSADAEADAEAETSDPEADAEEGANDLVDEAADAAEDATGAVTDTVDEATDEAAEAAEEAGDAAEDAGQAVEEAAEAEADAEAAAAAEGEDAVTADVEADTEATVSTEAEEAATADAEAETEATAATEGEDATAAEVDVATEADASMETDDAAADVEADAQAEDAGTAEAEATAEADAEARTDAPDETVEEVETSGENTADEPVTTDGSASDAADQTDAAAATGEAQNDAEMSQDEEATPLNETGTETDAETAAEAEAAPVENTATVADGEADAEAEAALTDEQRRAREERREQRREERRAQRRAEREAAAAAAAAAAQDSSADAEVVTEEVTEEDVRSSSEDFDTKVTAASDAAPEAQDSDSGLSDFEKALLLGLGAVAVGSVLNNGEKIVSRSGDRVVVQDPDGELRVLKDDNALIRRPGDQVQTQTFDDGSTRTIVTKADGSRIETIRARDGSVLRRTNFDAQGREYVLVDDLVEEREVNVSELPRVQENQRTVTASTQDEEALRRALQAQQLADQGRTFSLRQVREIPEVRSLAPQLELDAVRFPTGSAAIQPAQAKALANIGVTLRDMIQKDPRTVILVEGHTDAVGDASYNLALSDRRAETVALALTEYFDVPPENLVTQGYGESQLRVPTNGPEPANRRAVVRNITGLLR